MQFFPQNTVTHYTTQLPRQISLHGEWEVGLTEIQYPLSFLTIGRKENLVTLISKLPKNGQGKIAQNTPDANQDTVIGQKPLDARNYYASHDAPITVFEIRPGVYSSIEYLIDQLNDLTELREHVKFDYEKLGGHVTVTRTCTDQYDHQIIFAEKLRQQFGFVTTPLIVAQSVRSEQPASLARGIPDQLFVYTDIITPRIVGDVHTPLLRIIQTDTKNNVYGATQTKTLSPTNYIPLLLSNFRTIEIDIRDSLGMPIPFEFGTLTVTLHFKRIL